MEATEMHLKKLTAGLLIFVVSLTAIESFVSSATAALAQNVLDPSSTEFITVEELKSRIARNQPLTIIDVRATNEVIDSGTMIKGAFHVKLRKLKSRLALPPLKDFAREREIVTYCACPNDEASVRAAQVLVDAGFRHVRVLKGGWVAWKKAKGQIEPVASGM